MLAPFLSRSAASSPVPENIETLPQPVLDALHSLDGHTPDTNETSTLHVEADLNAAGLWGQRYLVATSQRVIVLSLNGAPNELAALNGAATTDGHAAGIATIDLDVQLSDIVGVEAKGLVGVTALEARIRGSGVLGGERVVELLRSSNARSKELNRAARQIEHLREHGTLSEDIEGDEAWQRQTCSSCSRALPRDTEVCPFCVNKWQAMRRLFTYVAPYKWIAIGNGLLSIVGIALSFVSPVIFARMVDGVFRGGAEGIVAVPADYRTLAILVGLIVLSQALGALANIVRGQWVAFLGARVLHDVRSQVYAHLQRLSISYYDKREVGAVMSRVQNDVGMLQNFLLDAAESIIISGLTILGVIVVLLMYSWQLTLVVLLPVPFVVIGTDRYWRGLMKLWRRVWHQNSSLGARLADALGGIRVVRAFGQEEREVDRFITKSGELRDATVNVERKAAIFYPVLGFVMGLGGPITWYIGGRQVLDGSLTLGGLTLFTVLLARLYEPVQVLTRMINFTTRAMTAAERVFEVLDTTPEVRTKENALPLGRVEGQVEFRDVTFGYDRHRPVLHGINIKVEPGEMIGLVGHSGAGKSTIINLLMRFYDVTDGALLVDGQDVRNVKLDDLRHQIGVVLQESYLFHGTIFDNITYGKPDATPADVMRAAKTAYAHDFIVSFPDGYDTLVGERGTRLSGGERQRIAIARAVLHDPRILILDEATASVDTETEQQIQMALRNLVQGRTTIAIAHRLSTLRHANRLIVVDHGKIVEQGSHDELMEQRGVFYKLVNAQKAMSEVLAIGG